MNWLFLNLRLFKKEVGEEIHEPYEVVVIDIQEEHQGAIMEEMGNRKADLQSLVITENGRMRLEFMAPSRGLIGFRSQFLTLTSGSGILTSVFDHYGLAKKGDIANRTKWRYGLNDYWKNFSLCII